MADLTLAQRFGSSVAFNATTKVLSIDLNNLTTITIAGVNYGLNISALTDTNKNDYASKILWSLILLSQANQTADNNDETVKLYVTNQGKRSITRNNVAQFGYQLVATAYQNDSLGVTLDPDNLA
ncbi:MAG: hypothetical protein RLZZ535_101 [Cyanobacteriota bacterium]|jgi:hypothetical protein